MSGTPPYDGSQSPQPPGGGVPPPPYPYNAPPGYGGPPAQSPYGYSAPPAPGIPGMVIAGFVLSFFCPILGLIFCAVGIGEAKRRNAGHGLAIAGIVISIVSLSGWALYAIFVFVVAASVATVL